MDTPYPSETGCCPKFDPTPWQDREHHWTDKPFIKDHVGCFCYIPLTFGRAMRRCSAHLERGKAFTPAPPLVLSDHTSRWNMDIYIEVPHPVPGADNVTLSGTFLSKVFKGSYRETANWGREMEAWAASQGQTVKRHLMYYTYCPKCARHYGENPVVYFVEV